MIVLATNELGGILFIRTLSSLFELLLWAQLTGMSTLLLSAVCSTGWKTCVTFSADRFVTVVSFRKKCQRRIVNAATKTQHQVQSGLFLNIVVRQCTSVFELLAGENQSLLIRRNSLLVLDLGLDVIDCIGRLNIERNSLARQGLYENLHGISQSESQTKRLLKLCACALLLLDR